jgi:YD repeat-containing protein
LFPPRRINCHPGTYREFIIQIRLLIFSTMSQFRSAIFVFMYWLGSLALNAQQVEHTIPRPDRLECEAARKQKLKVALRFGYLADNKNANSLRVRTEYNLQGYPLFIYRFDNEGEISEKLRYEYDHSDTLPRKVVSEQYKNGELDETVVYRADKRGRLIEYSTTDAQNRNFRTGYTYDASGHLLSSQVFEPDGLPGASVSFAYDARGNCTEKVEYDLGITVKRRTTFSFNAKDELIEEVHYLNNSTLLYRMRYSYDADGRRIRQDRFGRTGKTLGYESWSYKSDEIEHLTLDPGQQQPLREVIHSDLSGRTTERLVFDNDGSVFQWYQYEFDSTGTGAGFRRLRSKGEIDMEEMAIYDKEGRILQITTRYPDGSGDLKAIYRYDADGLPLEEKHSSFGQEAAVYWFVFEKY